MQTFLPYPDFDETARCLDRQRLGKQRVENLQIVQVLLGLSTGYANHPVMLQWRGYLHVLQAYHHAICREWMRRGYRDTCLDKVSQLINDNSTVVDRRRREQYVLKRTVIPWWLGYAPYHLSHQSNLMRKDAEYYRVFFPSVSDSLPYYWPKESF